MVYFSDWRRLKVAVAWFLRLKAILRSMRDKKRRPQPNLDNPICKGTTKEKVMKTQLYRLSSQDLLEAELAIIRF